ncbi:MAG: M56 family metallopeptidase [Mycobacteriales bacterium]
MHGWWVARRRRRRHLAVLRMIGRPRPGLGALVLDQVIEPVVYCLPGRAGRVVATAGALDRLTGTQLQAVLAHERAHLHGWHHLPLGAAQSLDRAFPGIALFRIAAVETARLVEMRADDVAARRYGCQQVAEALIALADGPAPRDALAAAGVETAQRVERMLSGRTHPLRAGWPSLTLVALFAVGPLVSVLLPILGMTVRYWGICPLPT